MLVYPQIRARHLHRTGRDIHVVDWPQKATAKHSFGAWWRKWVSQASCTADAQWPLPQPPKGDEKDWAHFCPSLSLHMLSWKYGSCGVEDCWCSCPAIKIYIYMFMWVNWYLGGSYLTPTLLPFIHILKENSVWVRHCNISGSVLLLGLRWLEVNN